MKLGSLALFRLPWHPLNPQPCSRDYCRFMEWESDLPVPLLRSLLILIALVSTAIAEDGPSIAAEAKDAANRLQEHLEQIGKLDRS